MTDKTLLLTRLEEAEEAYHLLMIGKQEVSVQIGDYGSVSYGQTDIHKLVAYISQLRARLTSKTRKPILVRF